MPMNNELNHATRRLLQVVLDMLINPDADKPREPGYGTPSRYRTSTDCVEAAWRAAREAQQMLEQYVEVPAVPAFPISPVWPPPVTCEPSTGTPPPNGVTVTCVGSTAGRAAVAGIVARNDAVPQT